jgi:hypothetical protein
MRLDGLAQLAAGLLIEIVVQLLDHLFTFHVSLSRFRPAVVVGSRPLRVAAGVPERVPAKRDHSDAAPPRGVLQKVDPD